MSRTSDAKKARRRKRQAARSARQMPAGLEQDLAEVASAVAEVNSWLIGRGWLMDEDQSTDDLLTWVYPPSAAEFGDVVSIRSGYEPFTRLWLTLDEDDDALVLEFGAALVGAGSGQDPHLIDPERLAEQIDALEAYRMGLPQPSFD